MKTVLLSIFVIFITFGSMAAQPPIPDPAGRWVVDDANVLAEATETTVSSLCQDEFDSTGNQVVVYTFPSLQGSTIEKYANEVYNQWKIGSEENKNGILLIIAIDDHQMRIEVGYGLEPYLNDLEAKDIIDNEIKPRFKEGDFDNGVLSGVQNIIYGIRNSYVAPYKPSESVQIYSGLRSRHPGWGFWIMAACWMGLSFWFSRMKIGEGIGAWLMFFIFAVVIFYTIWFWLYVTLVFVAGITFQIGLNKLWKPRKYLKFFGKGGGGGSWSTSSSSSYSYTSSSNSSSSSYSSGGGFHGGGGSSGGGGASGSW